MERFITLGVHPGTDNLSIPKYVEARMAGRALDGTTPLQVAERIANHSGLALSGLGPLESPESTQSELRKTLADIRAMALLGAYYSAKIRGATELALFRATADVAHRQRGKLTIEVDRDVRIASEAVSAPHS